MPYQSKPFAGSVVLTRSGSVGRNYQFVMPIVASQPRDPHNNTYPEAAYRGTYPNVIIAGKRSPTIGFTTYLKSSWVDNSGQSLATILNDFIKPYQADGESASWTIALNDGTQGAFWSNRSWQGCKCQQLSLAMNAGGGGIVLAAQFAATNVVYDWTFTDTLVPDAGFFYDTSQIDFGGAFNIDVGNGVAYGTGNGTADLVRGWKITLLRGTAWQYTCTTGSVSPFGVASGGLGGTVMLEQSPLNRFAPTGALGANQFTVRVYDRPANSVGAVQVLRADAYVNFDQDILEQTTQFGNLARTYTLFEGTFGSDPCPFS